MSDRQGLNRTLFWLYEGTGRWPGLFRWALLLFDLLTIAGLAGVERVPLLGAPLLAPGSAAWVSEVELDPVVPASVPGITVRIAPRPTIGSTESSRSQRP